MALPLGRANASCWGIDGEAEVDDAVVSESESVGDPTEGRGLAGCAGLSGEAVCIAFVGRRPPAAAAAAAAAADVADVAERVSGDPGRSLRLFLGVEAALLAKGSVNP